MKLRIATWNLNTWRNSRYGGASNEQQWTWANKHLAADVLILTEASTPPPAGVIANRWTTAHRPYGFPGTSRWGTVLAGRSSSHVRVTRITHAGIQKHELDAQFPGTLTAATMHLDNSPFATLIGLHLRYRKDKKGNFVGHPVSDLQKHKKDFQALVESNDLPLIIAGDFNFDLEDEEIGFPVPRIFERLAKGDRKLQNPFPTGLKGTFQQDWENGGAFNLDFIFLSKCLNERVVDARGGFEHFEEAIELSDHVPVLVELEF